MGLFLQDEWDLLQNMVNACHKNVKVPITCKTRIFTDIEKSIRYAQMLEKAGCQLLTVHGRTIVQKGPDTGLASWDHIKAIKDNVKIPVFANGNILNIDDVRQCIEVLGVQGVMSAEGILHNPALFAGINPPAIDICREYLSIVAEYPAPLSYQRGHLFKLCHHILAKHTHFRDLLGRAQSTNDLTIFLDKLETACAFEISKYAETPEDSMFTLPLPYWLCQPYIRESPKPGQLSKCSKRTFDLAKTENGILLSKNKSKKLKRNPKKNFEPSKKSVYPPCHNCANPKGLTCAYEFCKTCCKNYIIKEKLICVGHNINYTKIKGLKSNQSISVDTIHSENKNDSKNVDLQFISTKFYDGSH